MSALREAERAALIAAAVAMKDRAYCPYSHFPVGAALLDDRGTTHVGCNVENASYPVGLCAERAAIANAVSAGARRFRAIAIATNLHDPVAPCGMCRQALSEFAPDLPCLLVGVDGAVLERPLGALLPERFGPANLAEVQS